MGFWRHATTHSKPCLFSEKGFEYRWRIVARKLGDGAMAAQTWGAKWIGPAYDPRHDVGVFAFRRTIDLATVPEEMLVRVSADNRYKLYVNHQLVEFGPQRGEARHWFFETVDLAPYLAPGKNVVWALVWNFGYWSPMAQM